MLCFVVGISAVIGGFICDSFTHTHGCFNGTGAIMMTSSNWTIFRVTRLLVLCEGNPPVVGGFPHKGQWRGVLMFPFTCDWTNVWANNRNGGDLRRHCGHYEITVMIKWLPQYTCEVTLCRMGKIGRYLTTTKRNKTRAVSAYFLCTVYHHWDSPQTS